MAKNASRKTARDSVYKLIFEYMFNQGEMISPVTKETLMQNPELTPEDAEYIDVVLNGVIANYDELIAIISANAKNFRLDRIFKPDLAALLLAIYEMKYVDDIPLNVSISEAVNIVKEYSTEKSSIFVNGVLAGVYKQLTEQKGDAE